MRRWISCVRPDCLPLAASRDARSGVEPGSMEYSAVTQPLPLPRIQGGTRSSIGCRAEHLGPAEGDQDRAGRHHRVVPLEADGAELVEGTPVTTCRARDPGRIPRSVRCSRTSHSSRHHGIIAVLGAAMATTHRRRPCSPAPPDAQTPARPHDARRRPTP